LTVVKQAEVDLSQRCGDGPIFAVGNGVDLDYFHVAPQSLARACSWGLPITGPMYKERCGSAARFGRHSAAARTRIA
jgi:hypothetical protein